ncbi:hypothetical protein WME98_25320 [Sorangium sp. So ce296]
MAAASSSILASWRGGSAPPHALEQGGARRGDEGAAAIALEEVHAEGLLELRDLGRERRLRDAAGGRGAPEAAVLGDRERVLELAEREGMR